MSNNPQVLTIAKGGTGMITQVTALGALKGVGVLGTSSTIDATAIANTACCTIPASTNGAVILAVVVRPTNINAFVAVGTAEIKSGGGQSIFGSSALTGLNSTVKQYMYGAFNTTGLIVSAGDTVNIDITVGFTATAFDIVVDVIGYWL